MGAPPVGEASNLFRGLRREISPAAREAAPAAGSRRRDVIAAQLARAGRRGQIATEPFARGREAAPAAGSRSRGEITAQLTRRGGTDRPQRDQPKVAAPVRRRQARAARRRRGGAATGRRAAVRARPVRGGGVEVDRHQARRWPTPPTATRTRSGGGGSRARRVRGRRWAARARVRVPPPARAPRQLRHQLVAPRVDRLGGLRLVEGNAAARRAAPRARSRRAPRARAARSSDAAASAPPRPPPRPPPAPDFRRAGRRRPASPAFSPKILSLSGETPTHPSGVPQRA